MATWATCAECDGTGEVLCLACLGVGEEPDEDGISCVVCIGDGINACEPCDGAGGWFDE